MTFLESPRLNPRITQGGSSIVRASREKAYTRSGKLTQQFNWGELLHILDLSYSAKPLSYFNALRDFYYVVMGNAYTGFRAKDWSDYQLTQTNSLLSLVAGNEWQINRQHVAGAYQYLRPIRKPIDPVVIWRTNGASVTEATATIDYTTGIATISGHSSGDSYSAVGEFDIPVTFVDDKWTSNFRATPENLFLASDPIQLEELRAESL